MVTINLFFAYDYYLSQYYFGMGLSLFIGGMLFQLLIDVLLFQPLRNIGRKHQADYIKFQGELINKITDNNVTADEVETFLDEQYQYQEQLEAQLDKKYPPKPKGKMSA